MHLAPVRRLMTTGFAAVALSLSLTACGGGDSGTEAKVNPPSNSSDAPTEGDTGAGASDNAELPAELSDFPLPAEYTVRTAGARDGATTAILYDIPDDWTQTKTFYETELPKAGWEVVGDRPFVHQDGTELDATRDSMEVTVAISSNGDTTGLTINLIQP